MRWMWIDRIVELVPRERLVAIKNVSMAEDHLHDHFAAAGATGYSPAREASPVMPACFILEGMAQSAGVLVGHANEFREKVVLAKISKAELHMDCPPGFTLRYTAVIRQLDAMGASTAGTVEVVDPVSGASQRLGVIDLMFSHVDQNMAGAKFPAENFVFSESFRTLLRTSGVG